MRIPKKENIHNALWNVGAIVTLVAIVCRNQLYVKCSTVLVTVVHVVILFVNDDFV